MSRILIIDSAYLLPNCNFQPLMIRENSPEMVISMLQECKNSWKTLKSLLCCCDADVCRLTCAAVELGLLVSDQFWGLNGQNKNKAEFYKTERI